MCCNVCVLIQVVNLFNMFITYGDTFLPTSNSYDELYYEIVRMHQVFDNLYCMGMLVETAVFNLPTAETIIGNSHIKSVIQIRAKSQILIITNK